MRPYKAIIWRPEPDAIGVRKTYFAVDLADAKKQLLAEHGDNCISTLWNDEDRAKMRLKLQSVRMNIAHRIPRDRATPGRACGHISFVLKWPSGRTSARDWYRKTLSSIIRMFLGELERVPSAERSLATATMSAAIRKARGGEKWVPLASWSGTEPVESFLQAARAAWRKLPKEDDEHTSVPVYDDRFSS